MSLAGTPTTAAATTTVGDQGVGRNSLGSSSCGLTSTLYRWMRGGFYVVTV